MTTSTLRASVTAEAGGINQAVNPAVATSVDSWTVTGSATLAFETVLPAPSPIGVAGCGLVTWPSPAVGASLVMPTYGLVVGTQYIASLWVYVPLGDSPVGIEGGTDSGTVTAAWTRLSYVFTATGTDVISIVPIAEETDASTDNIVYFGGALVQPGDTLATFTLGGGQAGDPVQVLVDGADTPITANGLAGYIPTPGDRLLVAKVGGMVEVLQFLSRGTVPYLQNTDLSDLQAQVDGQGDQITATEASLGAVNDTLTGYMSTTDATLAGVQSAYDVLSGIGTAGVTEDYIWVGDDPALSTVKSVQISTYVQGGLFAGDYPTLSAYFNLWNRDDIGDVQFSGTESPPMTTFYTKFTDAGMLAQPWN